MINLKFFRFTPPPSGGGNQNLLPLLLKRGWMGLDYVNPGVDAESIAMYHCIDSQRICC